MALKHVSDFIDFWLCFYEMWMDFPFKDGPIRVTLEDKAHVNNVGLRGSCTLTGNVRQHVNGIITHITSKVNQITIHHDTQSIDLYM